MSDRAVCVLAALAAIGAWSGVGPPVVVGAAAVTLALAMRRPWVLCVTVMLLAGGRSAADAAGLRAPRTGPYHGWVELTSDPQEANGGGVEVEARIAGVRALLVVRGRGGDAMRARAAGDLVEVTGERRAVPAAAAWLSRRHISVRVTVTDVGAWHDGRPAWRLANAARDALARSATVLPPRQRGLYLGLVLGDERDEPPDIADDFRGAGLAHLLAVSGQNVAFVLTLAAPLLHRSSLRTRFVVTVGLLALFVLVTRAEPSVLRASVMAGVAALAAALGREATGLRVLALAVTALVVADPFLVRSTGFQMSVAASAAILTIARPLGRRLPGPRPVADVVAVSTAAQAGVAPVLAVTFGGVPVAGLLANVLAAPAAGPVMAWGMLAGLVGGVLGESASTVLHLPTRAFVWWLAGVARWASQLPLGEVGVRELVALGIAVLLALVGRRIASRALAALAVGLAVAALVTPGIALRASPPLATTVGPGAVLWRDGASVLVLDGRARLDDVLAGLRRSGVDGLDLVVVRSSSPSAGAAVDAIAHRAAVTEVVRPADVARADERRLGRLLVRITPAGDHLDVDVRAGQ